jgi:hypothetical protein
MRLTKKLALVGLCSSGFVLGIGLNAEAAYIKSLNGFYDAYGNDFSPAEQEIIEGAFNSVMPFMTENGKQNAIEAGFRPFLFPVKGHGEHFFFPPALEQSAVASMPTGLNFDENGELVAVFWTESKYPVPEFVDFATIDPETVSPEAFLAAYQDYKENEQLDVPSIFEPFGEEASWHSHENTDFSNIGTLNSEDIEFTQSLSDQEFVNRLLTALSDDTIVAAPYEQDTSLGYPPFNSLIVPGFYMIHAWLGLENPDSLFAPTHPDVAPNAIEEHLTFEDGSGGHGHSPHSPQSVPEPTSVLGLLTLTLGFIGSTLKRKLGTR